VGGDLESSRLVQLLPEHVHQKADILAVYPDRRNLSPKVRAFIDFLAERLRPGHGPGDAPYAGRRG
jgi:LysR family transcriptional regulator, transcriptional activator for dmlA